VAKNGKKSDKPAKHDKRGKRGKRAQLGPALTPIRNPPRVAPVAVAAGALVVAGITSLWRIRR
jgi:hypothetical protein